MGDRQWGNASRYRTDCVSGHYESYFQRANHPSRPLAFWIRYTIFSPKDRPHMANGELWAMYFDGETGRIVAVRTEAPISACSFDAERLHVRVGDALLDDGCLVGQAESREHDVTWNLNYTGREKPLLLLPRKYYDGGFPKAKALVGTPLAIYNGELFVDREAVPIDGWVGSQNHNWGIRHTDHYAWGQVAGFDNAPDAFLECTSARIRLGPIWSPMFTMVVLRLDGEEYALHSLGRALRAKARFSPFDWRWSSREGGVEIEGHLHASAEKFVGLTYKNPPGGTKTCLNSKIAACSVTIRRKGKEDRSLHTESRAAFEILMDGGDELGVPILP